MNYFLYAAANGNDSKKLRVEDRMDCPPSRVIHIRKLPNEVSETEVIALGLPFGKVTNILTLKGKNQVCGLSAKQFFAKEEVDWQHIVKEPSIT